MIQHRYTVFFGGGKAPPRDVIASSEEAAQRTAIYAERATGNKTRRLTVRSVKRLWQVGYAAGKAREEV
jgi:hypothetical protein